MRTQGDNVREWLAMSIAYWTTADGGADPNSQPSIYIDLLNLEWWQAFIAIIGVLGLSPGPWLLGLAVGRIQFTKQADAQHARELAAVKEAHAEELANLKQYHKDMMTAQTQRYSDLQEAKEKVETAHEAQKLRADTANEALAQAATAIEAGNHIIAEFTQAAKEVSVDGS